MRFTAETLAARPYTHGCRGRAEALVDNCVGKEIAFDLQPYTRGKGVIVAITPRDVTHSKRVDGLGNCTITYEVYDLEVEVAEGSHTGALWGGVAVGKAKDIAGSTERLNGLTYEQLRRAVFENTTYTTAYCG